MRPNHPPPKILKLWVHPFALYLLDTKLIATCRITDYVLFKWLIRLSQALSKPTFIDYPQLLKESQPIAALYVAIV